MSVTASGISRRFKEKWALKDVSFEAGEGRITGIFGPGGSGKSVLLRILAGLDKHFSGRFESGAGPAGSVDSVHLVGAEHIRPGMFSFLGRTAGAISAAEGQLAALKRAKALTNRIILLDEAFCHLGEDEKRRQFAEFRSIAKKQGTTVIFATPNFDEAVEFCDEIALINNGEVVQFGTAEKLYLEPESALVATLTGRNNVFEARRLTSSKADTPEFQSIPGSHRISVRGHSRNGLGAINQNVRLAIRPEHVSISFGASFPEDNLVRSKIIGVRFLGANTLVELDANGLRIDALVMRLVGLNLGDECMLGMPPDRIRIYV